MSAGNVKKILSYATLIVGGLIVGFGFMTMTDQKSPARGVASLHPLDNWEQPMIGKHLAPLRVHINLPASLPDREDQDVNVVGYVNLSQAVSGTVEYKWHLPEGTRIVEGEESGSLTDITPGQTVPIQISIAGFSSVERKVLSLEANTLVGNHKMGNSAVVSSRPEDSMEFIARAKMKSREEFDKASASLNQ